MEEKIITFTANEQGLVKTGGISHYASDTISYIKAVFTLGENWNGFDEVRAVFKSPYECRPAVLDSNGECYVPVEVLFYKGKVRVNLVGSIVTETEVTDRLTTYSVEALTIDEDVPISGDSSVPITPSEYEQFVANVANDANRAEAGATSAEASASNAESEAESALASAQASEASALRASGHAQNAQSAETSARAYAQTAQNYATDAENAKDDAIDARDEIRSMRANAETLEPNQSATASYSNGVLTLGIPKGQKGDTGDTGTSAGFGTVSASVGDSTGTPSVEVTASGTDTAKNFAFAFHNLKGAKGDKGDNGTVPDLDLILPTDTASGDIASITDGQSVVPVKSLKVTLEPIQDLHGYDKPWSAGAGKNLFGYTLADFDNGTAYASGTFIAVDAKAGSYTMSTDAPTGNIWFGLVASRIGEGTQRVYSGNPQTVTLAEDGQLAIGIATASKETALSYKTQLEKGSTATSYEPYSNICPISGHTECVTEVCGVNVWDEEWELGAITARGNYPSTTNIRGKNYIPCVGGATYFSKCSAQIVVFQYDENKTLIRPSSDPHILVNANREFTTLSNAKYMRFYTQPAYGATYLNDICINYPSTDHEYHAYNGTTYTTPLGQTVYGGVLDVVSGELTVTHALVDLGDLTWNYENGGNYVRFFSTGLNSLVKKPSSDSEVVQMWCSALKATNTNAIWAGTEDSIIAFGTTGTLNARIKAYTSASDFKTAVTGQTLCYPLATPQTYQLTPQTISLLHGNNNVWSDGDVELTYNADVGLYIDKKLGTSGTTTLSMTRTLAKSDDTESDLELTKSDNIQLAED